MHRNNEEGETMIIRKRRSMIGRDNILKDRQEKGCQRIRRTLELNDEEEAAERRLNRGLSSN